jgi:hypothetical protein
VSGFGRQRVEVLGFAAVCLSACLSACQLITGTGDLEVRGSGGNGASSATTSDATTSAVGSGAASVGGSGSGAGGSGSGVGGCGDTMSEPDDCGQCGHSCLGADCVEGECQPILVASGLDIGGVKALAVLDDDLFWGNSLEIRSCELPNCMPTTLVEGGPAEHGLAPFSFVLYWLTDQGTGSSVMNCSVAECATTAAPITQTNVPRGLAASAQFVFWIADNRLKRFDVNTGGKIDYSMDANGSAVAVDATHVYYTHVSAALEGEIRSCPHSESGCDASIVANTGATEFPLSIAVDDTHLYWSLNTSPNSIKRCEKAGCTTTLKVTTSPSDAFAIALHEDSVLFFSGGDLYRVAK